jgi:DNA mismatch repair protein MLH1
LENVIFPALKARLVGTKGMLTGVTEIANLKGLYRVFERC